MNGEIVLTVLQQRVERMIAQTALLAEDMDKLQRRIEEDIRALRFRVEEFSAHMEFRLDVAERNDAALRAHLDGQFERMQASNARILELLEAHGEGRE